MSVLVDTSVWSHAWRRDHPPEGPELALLRRHLEDGDVVTTGLVVQELLQGFDGPRAKTAILARLRALPLVSPELEDYVEAADLRTRARRKGVQVETIDALLAQLCIHHDLELLTADRDFEHLARVVPLRLVLA